MIATFVTTVYEGVCVFMCRAGARAADWVEENLCFVLG